MIHQLRKGKMTDKKRLKAVMILNGMTANDLAEKIGISRASFSYKINNLREFRTKEIQAIAEALNLSLEDKEMIFFADVVDEKST